MEKKKMNIKDFKVMELLSDPISMDIISTMEDETVDIDWLVKELDESRALIKDYLKNMEKSGLLIKTDKGYKTSANSYEGKELISESNKDNADWLRGFINHMENSVIDKLDILSKKEDQDDLYENLRISYSGVYLNDEEVKELLNFIENFLGDKDRKKRKDDSDYRKYHFYNLFFPDMKE